MGIFLLCAELQAGRFAYGHLGIQPIEPINGSDRDFRFLFGICRKIYHVLNTVLLSLKCCFCYNLITSRRQIFEKVQSMRLIGNECSAMNMLTEFLVSAIHFCMFFQFIGLEELVIHLCMDRHSLQICHFKG